MGRNGGPVFCVERVIGHKLKQGKVLYHVKWKGFGSAENTWEPESSFFDRRPLELYERRRQNEAKRRQRQKRNKFTKAPEKGAKQEENGANMWPENGAEVGCVASFRCLNHNVLLKRAFFAISTL